MSPDSTGGSDLLADDLCHAALSLCLASGAPHAEVAAALGIACAAHHLRALHARLRPDSPASRSSKPSAPAGGPRLAHKNRRRRQESGPSCVRATAGLNGTQLDLKLRPDPVNCCDLRKYRPGRSVPWIAAPDGRSWAPVLHEPLTRPDLAHRWRTATGNGLQNRP